MNGNDRSGEKDLSDEKQASGTRSDVRLYLPDHEGWEADIKRDWENEYCFSANPGEDYFHQLLNGEIYLRRGNEKYCLNCAVRMGMATFNRGFWQKSASSIDNAVEPPQDQSEPYGFQPQE